MTSTKFYMVIRSMSTSNSLNALVKPPIQIFGIEGRYANALYSAASKDGKLESVEKELVTFQGLLKTDPKLREFVVNPTVKRQLKAQGLKAISGKVNHSSYTTNLFQILAENGRLKKIDSIVNAFKTIMRAHRGEILCQVTTARALEPAQKQKLESVLKSFVKPNESIQLTAVVDPSIIGGIVLSIADRYVDMSVSNKIKKYTELISNPI